jgi:hypothetical protein
MKKSFTCHLAECSSKDRYARRFQGLARIIVLGSSLAFAPGAHADEAARVDSGGSVVLAASTSRDGVGVSPGAALAIGATATLVPLALAVAGDGNSTTWVAGLSGIVAGPAVGLWSGGRPDLAARGVLIRTLGLGALALGAATFGASFESDIGSGGTAVIVIGGLCGVATAVSVVYDLAITPGATKKARAGRVSLGVRPDGVVVVSTRF